MDFSIDHAAIIAFLDMIWDMLNYGNVLFYFLNFIGLWLCYMVLKHMGDDDRNMKTVEEDPTLNV
jgi:hypothetical protein